METVEYNIGGSLRLFNDDVIITIMGIEPSGEVRLAVDAIPEIKIMVPEGEVNTSTKLKKKVRDKGEG